MKIIKLEVDDQVADRLLALADPSWPKGVTPEDIVRELVDHAQQAVYRPGCWERRWVCEAFGEGWLTNLEPDPANASVGWQRRKRR
jgi:hypothetical protein